MIALIALLLQVITLGMNNQHSAIIKTLPPTPSTHLVVEYENGCACDDCYWTDCFMEGIEEFDALFNSYETKRAKNGVLMIRSGNSGPYRFAKKG